MIPLVETLALAALLLGVADPQSLAGQGATRTAYRSQDSRGREAVVSWSGVPSELTQVTRQYGPNDGPLAVTEYRSGGNVEVAYGYDDRFLVTGVTRGAEAVTYGYTASGERSWEQSPGGRTDYDYDPMDRLWHATSTRGSTEFVWEPGGARLLDVKAPNLTECRRYDARGRQQWMDGRDPGADCDAPEAAPIARFEYGYDERGNRTSETYNSQGVAESPTQYGYDAADRLTSVVSPSGAETTYDLLGDGSRNTVTTAPTQGGLRTIESYHYDARGGLTGITDEANQPVATYQVDPAGHVLSETRAGRSKSFTWDADGRLTAASVTENGATTASSFRYDHQGLRIWKQGPSGTTTYLWGAGELAEEVLPSGTRLRYERGAGLALAVGGETLLHDGLGSVVGRVGLGAPVMYRYDAWGSFQGTAGPTAAEPSLAYAGQHWDADLGLSYAQQRWYQPEVGRFLSEDPVFGDLTQPNSLQAFGYAGGNPLRYTDENGEAINLAAAGVGGLIGGVGGCIFGAWNAQDGDRLAGCGKGGAIGAGAGALAGLTFGASLAVTGAVGIGGAAVAGGGTAGSVIVSGTLAGAVAGGTSSAATVLANGGTGQQAWEMGTIGAFTGSVSGAVSTTTGVNAGMFVLGKTGNVLMSEAAGGLAGGFTASATSQSISIVGGTQKEFSGSDLAISTLQGGVVGGTVGAANKVVSRKGMVYDLTPQEDTGQPILFGQKGVSPRFSRAGNLKNADVNEVAGQLISGELPAGRMEIEYVWVNGQKATVNNRSLTALSKARLEPPKPVNMSGKLSTQKPDRLVDVLQRLDEMGGSPSETIGIRQTDDWSSPPREQVTIPRRRGSP